jgi:ABC-type multidrug transport system ATPase subunit
MPTESALATDNLTCRYGRNEAVSGLTLSVQPGTLFALLGPNGAGKTTTIRTLMNILRPASGRATVLGVDSRRLAPAQLMTIGYVSENQMLPLWMTVGELLAYCRPWYPSWDDALCRKLLADFDLPLTARIGRLSRGMRVKAALVSSLAYRPKLLVLDEPFSGLDPVVRDDLVRGVLELAGDEQWTVFLSSHDLDEVERLVDAVGFIDRGTLVLTEGLADLHARFRRVEVTIDSVASGAPFAADPSWVGLQQAGRLIRFVETRYAGGETERRARDAFAATRVEVFAMTLREIFVAIARDRREVRP